MGEKLIDHEASIEIDDDGDVFIEMIFPNGRVGLTFGHTIERSAVFSVGKSGDGTTKLFHAPRTDEEMNTIREHFVKLMELFPEQNMALASRAALTPSAPAGAAHD